MTPEAAAAKAEELNTTGRYRSDWFYYPTIHTGQNSWFVMRRRKRAEVYMSVSVDGKTSIREWSLVPIFEGKS